MNNVSWKRAGAIRLLGGFSLASIVSIASAQTPASPASGNDAEDTTVLERFEVTGSRVTRIAAEGPNPVRVFSRADLNLGGYNNIGDVLRTLPYTSGSSLTPAGSGTSFTPGASTANLRGLGNNNVLVLLNGRRAAPLSTPGFNGLQTVFDFNTIPSAAIESIEILKDAGSAIYGSDAVSGVINVKLLKNYDGVSTEIGFGNTLETDSFEKSFTGVVGTHSAKASVLVTVDWKERNKIKDRDTSFSSNANLTSRGGPDLRSYASYPALVYVPSLEDYYTPAAPIVRPTRADFQIADLSHGNYNFQEATDLLPETRAYGFYTRGEYKFTPTITGFVEVAFRRSEARIEAAPAPVFNFAENGDGPETGFLNIPANNPNNPFGENLEAEWYARLSNAGNRINDVSSDTPRFLAGLQGTFAESWHWEGAALYTTNESKNLNGGTVFDNLYQKALNGVVIDGETLYANPFGPEDPRLTRTYVGTDANSSSFELRTYDFSIGGDIFELPAGAVGFATGGEYRTEQLESIRTINNETGNVVGGGEGSGTFGDRRVYAFYAELGIPLVQGLEAQIAGRFEHYSDFGSTTKPKLALSYRPSKTLLLRASFGQSFLAPNLSYLYTSQVTSFSGAPLRDPKRPQDSPRQIQTVGGGNRNLQPEETDTYYAGIQWEPKGRLGGLSISLDYLKFSQKSLIAQLGDEFILDNEDTLPGAVVRNPPAAGEEFGVISFINDAYRNIDRQMYQAFDLETQYDFKETSVGNFRLIANATHVFDFVYNNEQDAGTYNQPKWRSAVTLQWEKGDWAAALQVTHIGRFGNFDEEGKIGTQIFVNPQITYSGFWDTDITVGARNVFDREPPFDRNSPEGWNSNIHDPEPAFVYVRIGKEW